MGMIHIFERGGDDLREYKKAVKMAKEAIDMICELTDEMEDKFSSRGGYGEREGGMQYRHGMYGREMDEMSERRYRDGMGRYR